MIVINHSILMVPGRITEKEEKNVKKRPRGKKGVIEAVCTRENGGIIKSRARKKKSAEWSEKITKISCEWMN